MLIEHGRVQKLTHNIAPRLVTSALYAVERRTSVSRTRPDREAPTRPDVFGKVTK